MLEDSRSKPVPPLEQIKARLTQQVENENVRKMLDDMKAKAKIEIIGHRHRLFPLQHLQCLWHRHLRQWTNTDLSESTSASILGLKAKRLTRFDLVRRFVLRYSTLFGTRHARRIFLDQLFTVVFDVVLSASISRPMSWRSIPCLNRVKPSPPSARKLFTITI